MMNKGMIKVRMFNADREVKGITRPADGFGFEGLIITPVIELGETEEGFATIPITEDALKELGITEDEAFAEGIKNTEYTIKTMRDVLIGGMFPDGIPEEDREMVEMMFPQDDLMYVVSNENNFYGASSVISATKELIEKFPDGYVVLPSSVHEVIVVPKGRSDNEELNNMVREINAGVVEECDRLSDDVYEFVA